MGSPLRSDRCRHPIASRGLVLAAVTVLALGSAVLALAGAALAYDQVAILSPSPSETEAEPGEEFEVTVEILAEGHGDDGVAGVDLVARYHPDYLEVRDVAAGPWLGAGGDETSVETDATVANSEGTTVLETWRDPVAGGAGGEGELATLTVAVREDAEPGVASIDFADSDVELAGDWPMPIHDGGVDVAIDGGEEPVEPFDHPDPADLETDGDEPADGTVPDEETDADPAVDGTLLTTIVAGVVLLLYAVYRRQR